MKRTFASLLALALTIAACTTAGPTPVGGPISDEPVRGGRIIAGAISDIQQLNPILSASGVDHNVWELIYGVLVHLDPETGDNAPGLASEYSLSPDGLKVIFKLRDGLFWSDGVAFTGEDYKYTVEAVARAKGAVRGRSFTDVAGFDDYAKGRADSITGIAVSADGKTITVTLTQTLCTAIAALGNAGGGVLPKHRFLAGWNNKTTDITQTIDNHPLNLKPPVSMGPYVFESQTPGVEVVLKANDRYYRGRPNIDQYVVKTYSNSTAVKVALLAGELSFATVPSAAVAEVQIGNPNLEFTKVPSGIGYTRVTWNHKSIRAPWLGNKEVRQALWYGLNVQGIIDAVYLGLARPVYSHLAPVSWAYDESGLNKYAYSVSRAKTLIEGAGAKMGPDGIYLWSDGKPMEMRINTPTGNDVTASVIQIIQEQYKQIGIKVDPHFITVAEYFTINGPGKLDREGTIGGWSRGPDPDAWHFYHTAGPFNWFNYSDPVMDKAIIDGRHGPDCSQPARKRAYKLIDDKLNAEAVSLYMFVPIDAVFHSKSIQNFSAKPFATPGASNRNINVEEWWIKN